jgi:hypothetical protein
MTKNSIRVQTKKFRINVNDNGDEIILDFDNNSFMEKFYNLTELGKNIPKMDEIAENTERMRIFAEYNRKISNALNDIFGENATLKIFGCKEPMPDLIADFFEQLAPFIEKAGKMRENEAKMRAEKYSKRAENRESVRK